MEQYISQEFPDGASVEAALLRAKSGGAIDIALQKKVDGERKTYDSASNAAGWYRICTGAHEYTPANAIISINHIYASVAPSNILLEVNTNATNGLRCLTYEGNNGNLPAITNARVVQLSDLTYAVDVYQRVLAVNTWTVGVINLGYGTLQVQTPTFISSDDTLPTGETLRNVLEWANPPMRLGVEYRTTERCKGRPVYAKRIHCESMPSGAGSIDIRPSDTEVPNALISTAIVIRCYGRASVEATIPFYTGSGDFMQVGVVFNNTIRIYTAKAYGGTAEITAHYVKSTD